MHHAARKLESDIVIQLVESGANINAREDRDYTPLHLAVGDVSLVRWLLLKGADYKAKTDGGLTPLEKAREDKATQTVHLLETWAEVKSGRKQPNQFLREALAMSTYKAQRILDAIAVGADDVAASDGAARTALHWAAQQNETDLVSLLLERGADIGARDNLGNTPMMLAHQKGCADVEEVLRAWAAKKPAKKPTAKTGRRDSRARDYRSRTARRATSTSSCKRHC